MMREKSRWALLGLVVVAAFAVYACQPYQPTTPGNVTVSNSNVNQVITGSSPAPGGNGTCNAVGSVDISVPAATLKVGSSILLDATPKDPAGQTRADACNVADGVAWGVAGPCTVSPTTSFNPVLGGIAAGTCAVSATVHGVTSETRAVVVVP